MKNMRYIRGQTTWDMSKPTEDNIHTDPCVITYIGHEWSPRKQQYIKRKEFKDKDMALKWQRFQS